MSRQNDNKLLIYVPDGFKQRLAILPPRSASRICREALLAAVARAEEEQEQAIDDIFSED